MGAEAMSGLRQDRGRKTPRLPERCFVNPQPAVGKNTDRNRESNHRKKVRRAELLVIGDCGRIMERI